MPSTNDDALKAGVAQVNKYIRNAKVQAYKPIAIAETLYCARMGEDISDFTKVPINSLNWGKAVALELLDRSATSTHGFNLDIWGQNGISKEMLDALNAKNQATDGAVECEIYFRLRDRVRVIADVIAVINDTAPEKLTIDLILKTFDKEAGIKRSKDKVYEIVTYSLLSTLITTLKATVTVDVPSTSEAEAKEVSRLISELFGRSVDTFPWTQDADVYRAGVTNAADRGIDIWANFGPVIQVKYVALNLAIAKKIVGQIKSKDIIIICKTNDGATLEMVAKESGWGKQVRSIITKSDLDGYYERCLRSDFKGGVPQLLKDKLLESFEDEFPQVGRIELFMKKRGYVSIPSPGIL